MKGKIEVVGAGALQGQIRAEDGSRVPFELGGIVAYDAGRLRVGHSVTFDFDKRQARAVNVCRDQEHPLPFDRRSEAHVRYMGFEHIAGTRSYRFERSVNGEPSRTVVMTIEVGLFSKHRVTIQEGPALCLRLLANPATPTPARQEITEDDMLAFLASRATPASHRAFRRR